jgi:hypothetical protein
MCLYFLVILWRVFIMFFLYVVMRVVGIVVTDIAEEAENRVLAVAANILNRWR